MALCTWVYCSSSSNHTSIPLKLIDAVGVTRCECSLHDVSRRRQLVIIRFRLLNGLRISISALHWRVREHSRMRFLHFVHNRINSRCFGCYWSIWNSLLLLTVSWLSWDISEWQLGMRFHGGSFLSFIINILLVEILHWTFQRSQWSVSSSCGPRDLLSVKLCSDSKFGELKILRSLVYNL